MRKHNICEVNKREETKVYKIMPGMDKVDKDRLFPPFQFIKTSGHPLKFNPERIRTEESIFYFCTKYVIQLGYLVP